MVDGSRKFNFEMTKHKLYLEIIDKKGNGLRILKDY